MERRLVQLNFSATFNKVSHRGLFYNLTSICVGEPFLSVVSKFLNDRRQRVHLDCKVSASVDVVWGLPQSSVLGSLLFILYTTNLFHIVESHIMDCADETTIYAVIYRSLSRRQVMESLNQDLAAINPWCLKWYMRLNPKKTKSIVVSRS